MRPVAVVATGKTPYPVQRSLVSGGMLDAALESRVRGHTRQETPDLEVRYEPPTNSGFMRGDETNPG